MSNYDILNLKKSKFYFKFKDPKKLSNVKAQKSFRTEENPILQIPGPASRSGHGQCAQGSTGTASWPLLTAGTTVYSCCSGTEQTGFGHQANSLGGELHPADGLPIDCKTRGLKIWDFDSWFKASVFLYFFSLLIEFHFSFSCWI